MITTSDFVRAKSFKNAIFVRPLNGFLRFSKHVNSVMATECKSHEYAQASGSESWGWIR